MSMVEPDSPQRPTQPGGREVAAEVAIVLVQAGVVLSCLPIHLFSKKASEIRMEPGAWRGQADRFEGCQTGCF